MVRSGHVSMLEASAASPTVAQLLSTIAQPMEAWGSRHVNSSAPGGEVSVVDVVPLSRSDPKGAVLGSALSPLTICSILVAAAVGVVVRFRPAWRQLVSLTTLSAVAGLGTSLIAQSFLGVLPH